ncbi:unnamed protein product [Linum trigynum]|uniref:Uncharacterized protein n=1 Tax=Linum trigynum TaxID=586398 RepID=A0AAV2GQ32_9ROSI
MQGRGSRDRRREKGDLTGRPLRSSAGAGNEPPKTTTTMATGDGVGRWRTATASGDGERRRRRATASGDGERRRRRAMANGDGVGRRGTAAAEEKAASPSCLAVCAKRKK